MKSTLHLTMTLFLSSSALLFSPVLSAQNADVVVHDAWIRVPLPSQNQTALYFVIENHAGAPRAIVSASSPAAEKIELHEEKMDASKKMMSMTPIARISVPASGKVMLQSGGYHMMVFGLKSRPVTGSTFPFSVTLDDGSTIAVTAMVRDQAGEPMKDMNMKK